MHSERAVDHAPRCARENVSLRFFAEHVTDRWLRDLVQEEVLEG